MEVVASLSQGRTAAAQCGLFTHKSVPVIFEPPCTNGTLSSSKSRIFFRSCEGYVRSKALDLEGSDYDKEWH